MTKIDHLDSTEEPFEHAVFQLARRLAKNPRICISLVNQVSKETSNLLHRLFEPDEDGTIIRPRRPDVHEQYWDSKCSSSGNVDPKLLTKIKLVELAVQTAQDGGNDIPFDVAVLRRLADVICRARRPISVNKTEYHEPLKRLLEESDRIELSLRFRNHDRPDMAGSGSGDDQKSKSIGLCSELKTGQWAEPRPKWFIAKACCDKGHRWFSDELAKAPEERRCTVTIHPQDDPYQVKASKRKRSIRVLVENYGPELRTIESRDAKEKELKPDYKPTRRERSAK